MMPRSISLAAVGCGILIGLPVVDGAAVLQSASAQSTTAATPGTRRIAAQREAFREIYAEVELGNWQLASDNETLLHDYVLWPDLQAAYIRQQIRQVDDATIRTFLDRYGTLKPARELRYRYALHLAATDRLDEYLAIYQRYYQGLDLAKLDCLALQAEIASGHTGRIINRAKSLWLVGRSQDDACDPVFAALRAENLLSTSLYRERYDLAIDARQYSLARYLARSIDPTLVDEAQNWLTAHNSPEDFLRAAISRADGATTQNLVLHALRRLALHRPLLADELWQSMTSVVEFDTGQQNEIQRYIALWAAREHLPEARSMLEELPTAAVDTETIRWRIRVNLQDGDWQAVLDNANDLPADELERPEWRFWRAAALRETGATAAAEAALEILAAERSYYGFLAADMLDTTYAFEHAAVKTDNTLVTELNALPELVRARELFLVGLEGRGRSEWDAAIRAMSRDKQLAAAQLAHRWGWHSRAIATVAKAGDFDDLDIRYPLPWQSEFTASSSTADIPDSWAYGIARSESLFMRDIRSSAGAIGIMQLMPATGRETAGEINLRYGGTVTLTDVSSNIKLGTAYLGKMYNRFADNRVLATAAYNAGPHRVEKWLPESGDMDGRIWIETIPFRETREYVRRVLADAAVFHWRLTGKHQRITAIVPRVTPDSDTQQVASTAF